MKLFLRLSSVVSALVLATGCATIVSKSEYPVNIKSTPSGTAFAVYNRAGEQVSQGVTPQIVTLKAGAGYFRGEKYKITFTMPNAGKNHTNATKTIELDTSIDGWYLGGNLIFGGLLGYLVIDPATGAMFKLPEEVNADLMPSEQTLNILSIETLTAEQREKLQPIHL